MNINDYERQYERVYCKHNNAHSPIITEGMILFDEDTADHLAGPFKGNYAYYRISDANKILMPNHKLPTLSELKQTIRFSRYLMPNRLGFKDHAQSEEHLQKRLDLLTARELKEWQHQQDSRKIDIPTVENPIKFYICGNDDTSYSKFFPTVEKALEEEKLFLETQPINYYLHIAENGFISTN